ncbi:hypothetical protein UlMin_028935 [Ulmus minor]
MTMFRGMSSKKKNNLKIVAEKLQKSFLFGRKLKYPYEVIPKDVKEGHFAVIAVEGDEPKRFVVPLSFLAHPIFLRLLEQAAEEYGFDHDGALTVPCPPSELERILGEQWEEGNSSSSSNSFGVNWGSCKTMVQSY